MMAVRLRVVPALLLLLLAGTARVPAQSPAAHAPSAADIDGWVQRSMKTFEVPGMAVAVVKDGHVVVAKGYGVRKLGQTAPVDAGTLFGIASNTKAFTATALGILVDEGKIRWDARVIDYLPWFQLSDPYVTREMTVRDLLVHRSGLGLGAGDLLWWPPSTYNRREIVARLRYLPLATSFRSAYAYDNVLYLVAGEVIEAVSGRSWEDFVQSRVLAMVGMTSSNVRHSAALAGGNVAATHARVDGKVRPIAPFDSDNTNAAGGVNSCADDMAKWLIVQLNEGKLPDGTALIQPATARQLTTLVTPIPIGNYPTDMADVRPSFSGYGLGFALRDYRGQKQVTHTGGLPGYVSKVAMLPGLRLGIAILTNQESSAAYDSVANQIMDAYLGAPAKDWIATYDAIQKRALETVGTANARSAAARDTQSRPSLPLDRYAGTYRDPWYGEVVIAQQNGGLTIRFSHTPSLSGMLEHWQHDTFVARWTDRELRADAFVTFALTPDGRVEEAKMRAVSPETDFSFDFQDLLLTPVSAPGRR